MVIDFHTHTFPDAIAGKALASLSATAHISPFSDGTVAGLKNSMKEAKVTYSLLLPVVTKPSQAAGINELAVKFQETFRETGLCSFGGIHPECENYKDILKMLAENGVKGIKIHPVFHGTDIDDPKNMRIIDEACNQGLYVITHAGMDIGFPGVTNSSVEKIVHMLDTVKPDKMILAHMGGWDQWEQVKSELLGRDIYIDTAFSMKQPLLNVDCLLSSQEMLDMIRLHGADKVLFGTDSPWSSQAESIEMIQNIGLTSDELDLILYQNAEKIIM